MHAVILSNKGIESLGGTVNPLNWANFLWLAVNCSAWFQCHRFAAGWFAWDNIYGNTDFDIRWFPGNIIIESQILDSRVRSINGQGTQPCLQSVRKFKMASTMKPKTNYNKKYKDSYHQEWPRIIKSRKGQSYAFCTTCSCDVSVKHGGRNDDT